MDKFEVEILDYSLFNHISDLEIIQDINDTQIEINNYSDELKILKENPVENKLDIYLREGKISSRIDFINKLKKIQSFRLKENK